MPLLIDVLVTNDSITRTSKLSIISCGKRSEVLPPTEVARGALPGNLDCVVVPGGSPSGVVRFEVVFETNSMVRASNGENTTRFLRRLTFNKAGRFPSEGLVRCLRSLKTRFNVKVGTCAKRSEAMCVFCLPGSGPGAFSGTLLVLES